LVVVVVVVVVVVLVVVDDDDDDGTIQAECVGFIDSEIRAMSWSPDYELLILVTGNGTILSMTQEWDIVAEVPVQEQQVRAPFSFG